MTRGMLLCAGKGTRLAPLTDHLPKPLIPVLNRPMLLYNLLLLRQAGVRQVMINLHHLGDLIFEVLGDGADLGLEITYHREAELLGTGGGLHAVAEFLTSGDGPCLVANGDSLVEADLAGALAEHNARGADGTMVLVDHPDPERYGAVRTDAEGRIVGIGRVTDGPKDALPVVASRVFCGLAVLSPGFFKHLTPGPSCVVRTAWKTLIDAGGAVYGAPVARRLHDCGTPDRLLAATRDLLDHPAAFGHLSRSPHHVAAGVVVEPPVLFGPDVEIGTDARIGPHVVLGPGARVATGVQLSEAVVLPGVTVEQDAHHAVIG